MTSDKCFFRRLDGTCGALADTYCDGYKEGCSFFKTTKMYVSERDKAISKCREKGHCKDCKYAVIACRLSSEEKVYDPFR